MIGSRPLLQLRGSAGVIINEVTEDNISHPKAKRRKTYLAIAHERNQVVVAASTCEGALAFGAVEYLEDQAGVVGKAANDRQILLHVAVESPGAKVGDDGVEFAGLCSRIFNEGLDILERNPKR